MNNRMLTDLHNWILHKIELFVERHKDMRLHLWIYIFYALFGLSFALLGLKTFPKMNSFIQWFMCGSSLLCVILALRITSDTRHTYKESEIQERIKRILIPSVDMFYFPLATYIIFFLSLVTKDGLIYPMSAVILLDLTIYTNYAILIQKRIAYRKAQLVEKSKVA